MSKPKTITLSPEEAEWVEQGLDFIREVAIQHANPEDPTMEEWEPVYDAADDIQRMLADKKEVQDERG